MPPGPAGPSLLRWARAGGEGGGPVPPVVVLVLVLLHGRAGATHHHAHSFTAAAAVAVAAANHRPVQSRCSSGRSRGCRDGGAAGPQRGQTATPPLRCTAQRGMIGSLAPPFPPHCSLPQCPPQPPTLSLQSVPPSGSPATCSSSPLSLPLRLSPSRGGEERRSNRGGRGDRPTDRRVVSPGAGGGCFSFLLRSCPRATVRYSYIYSPRSFSS